MTKLCVFTVALLISRFAAAQTLTLVAGNGEVAFAQFPTSQNVPLTVRATDASGKPLANIPITWSVTQGSATLLAPAPVTDASGIATTEVLGTLLIPSFSYANATVTASAPFGSVNFVVTSVPSTPAPSQPTVDLVQPSRDNPSLTVPAGATVPAAIVAKVIASSGVTIGQGVPNVGIRVRLYDPSAGPDSGPPPAHCNAPGGDAISDASGTATCDLVVTGAQGVYTIAIETGEILESPPITLTITPGQTCTYVLSSQTQSFAATGGSGSVSVTTAGGCTWTAVSNASFITVNSGAAVTGSGTVTYTVFANTAATQRNGTITIAGQAFNISQAGTSGNSAPVMVTSPTTLATATLNATYSVTLAASGGTPPYSWTSSGVLPPGITLSSAGVLSGTPTAPGVYSFTVIAKDSTGAASQPTNLSLTVTGSSNSTLHFLNVSFANGTAGQAYQQSIQTSGGCVTPFQQTPSIRITGGALPDGLALIQGSDMKYAITGTPTTNGSFTFSLTAMDACGSSTTATFTISVGTGVVVSPLTVTPANGLTFSVVQSGAEPQSQQLMLSSPTPTAYTATATTTSGGTWLAISSGASGLTPAAITVGVKNFSTLPPATYTGMITIVPQGGSGSPVQVPVTLNVAAAPSLTASSTGLTFNVTSGAPMAIQQVFNVSSTGTATVFFTAGAQTSSGGSWLTVTPTSANTPTPITVTVNPAKLANGTYSGTIYLTPVSGTAVAIPVTTVVTGGPMLSANATSLSFSLSNGSTGGTTQTISLTSGPPLSYQVSISPSSASNWLSVTPSSGLTPATLSISVNPSTLSPGANSATITISDPTGLSPSIQITVTATFAGLPAITSVTNAASFQPGPIAPGEILVIFGTGLGPSTLASAAAGQLGTTLAGTQVLFDDTPAPVLYASATQLAVITPYAINGRATTQVSVQAQGQSSSKVTLNIVDANPAIFTLDPSGQGAILNPDATVNGLQHPAPNSSIISIFGTGGGQTTPPQADGVLDAGVANTAVPATVQIDNLPATVFYSGAAPGFSGMVQWNVMIPNGARRGVPVPVTVTMNGVTSPSVTMYIQP